MLERAKNVSIDAVIAAPAGLVSGIILSELGKMGFWSIAWCVALISVAIWGLLTRSRMNVQQRIAGQARFFLNQLGTIPKELEGDDAWNHWTAKMEALLRGAGYLRKSQVLQQIIARADAQDRETIAENFFRGLAQEATKDAVA